MAGISGKSGTVTVNGVTHLKVTTWSLTPTKEAVESTGMSDSGYRTFEVGLRGATFSASANWDSGGATGEPPDFSDDKVAFSLTTDTAPAKTYSGTCIVTSSPVEVSVDGLVTYSIEATVDGTLTIA